MDAQEKKLREKTAGTGVDVVRDGDNLLLRMPSGITFAYDSDAVQPQFQPTLNEVASVLTQYPKTYIDIYGHTDADGSEAYNQGLSERRATSVQNYLAAKGVQSVRMATKGYGETQPIASNETAEGKAQNRRVEIKIVPVTESDVASGG
jgi:outer membrane protein OmpA-like peptidoglycan-associated protein